MTRRAKPSWTGNSGIPPEEVEALVDRLEVEGAVVTVETGPLTANPIPASWLTWIEVQESECAVDELGGGRPGGITNLTVPPEFDTDSCICANAAQHESGMALGTEKRKP